MGSAESRFWSKVEIGKPDECWEWKAQRRNGYGVFSFQCKSHPSARMAHYFSTGDLVLDRFLCHRCDNPACCNPAHIFVGTHADNMADKAAKGRQFRGERHHLAKLNPEKVAQIKAMLATKRNSEIAPLFDVTRQAINSIRQGKSWRHV